MFSLLHQLRYDGIYDGATEGIQRLPVVLRAAVEHRLYVSPSLVQHLKAPRKLSLDTLTSTEEVVLSVLGDGSDDVEAAERLNMSGHTVHSHRKSIMAKLRLHHKGALMCYAAQNGYIVHRPEGIYYPGFQRVLNTGRPSQVPGSPPLRA